MTRYTNPCTPATADLAYVFAFIAYLYACRIRHGRGVAGAVLDACDQMRVEAVIAEWGAVEVRP